MAVYIYDALEHADQIRVLELQPSDNGNGHLHAGFCLLRLRETRQWRWIRGLITHLGGAGLPSNSARRGWEKHRHHREPLYRNYDISLQDDAEKSAQVKLMSRIHRSSARVHAWIGESTEESEAAFCLFKQLAGYISDLGINSSMDHFVTSTKTNSSCIAVMGADESCQAALNETVWGERLVTIGVHDLQIFPLVELQERARRVKLSSRNFMEAAMDPACLFLYNKPWFSRVWICQEAVLAPVLVLCCGKSQLEWETFASAVFITSLAGLEPGGAFNWSFRLALDLVNLRGRRQLLTPIVPHDAALPAEFKHTDPSIYELSHRSDTDEAEISATSKESLKYWWTNLGVYRHQQMLSQLAVATQQVFEPDSYERIRHVHRLLQRRQCSDDRDRVDGVFGLYSREVGSSFQPDYSLSVRDMYIVWSHEMLMAGKADWNPSHNDALPSWVPEHRLRKLKTRDSLSWYQPTFSYMWESFSSHILLSTEASKRGRLRITAVVVGQAIALAHLAPILNRLDDFLAAGQYFASKMAAADMQTMDDRLFPHKLERVRLAFGHLM
ncbi:hypothetical protein B0H66DRAFT_594479 [Apodospora peruviana]|uniref:Heterokaryon incompatibility domain-containing protein n=1 Tax=Apodospora peruviana TaxID=516989 RepID=A0AAE0HVE7_9PEZI|nr:hypothetical protein B0H66DRAFT_594479 [Apodospora peruviana]